jgi:hypothetical protein
MRPARSLRDTGSGSELGEALLEEASLGVGVHELERAFVGGARLLEAVEAAQELGAGRVQVVVLVEFEALDEREGAFGVSRLGHGGGFVQLHDGRAGAPCQLAVEGRELRPVRGVVGVQGGDRCLQRVRIAPAERERAV